MAFRFKSETGHSWLETVLSKYVTNKVTPPPGK